jgi:hypothetical protein
MATLIEAIREFGPRLKLNDTVSIDVLAEWIAMRTTFNKNVILLVLHEVKEAILFFTSRGTPVMLPGLGRISPSISYEGQLRINMKMDSSLRRALNQPDAFSGHIKNKANIGLAKARLKARWDQAYPDNPLKF